MEKKRVLLVHNYYQIGGGEHTVFHNEAAMLNRNGYRVVEYTRSNEELKHSFIKKCLLPLSTVWSWRTFFAVRRLIKREKIEIVHCHNTFPLVSPSVYYAARSCNVPVVQTIHNYRFLCPNGSCFCQGRICEKCISTGSFKPAIQNRCYRGSRLETWVLVSMLRFHRALGTYSKVSYIFLSEFTKNKFSHLIDITSDQVFVKPNFVTDPSSGGNPTDIINEARGQKKYFVFAGRLEENKGILLLLDMWKSLPTQYVLRILGDGTLREQVENAARDNTNIEYMGFVSHEDVLNNYREATAVVIPSIWYETFGMGIPESFSLGVPVVATNIGNHGSMVIESQGGETYAIDDKKGFVNAIEKVVLNRESYSQKAYDYYQRMLSEKENMKRLGAIYDKSRKIEKCSSEG